jgi:hypothetical protein
MKTMRLLVAVAALAAVACALAPNRSGAQQFALDPMSATLPGIPATSGDIFIPSGPIPPSAAPPPLLATPAAALGLLPGDVIDALSCIDDAGPGATLYFSVDRASTAGGFPAGPPDVGGESVFFVPIGIQGEAASDIFVAADPACGIPPGFHSQILDGNGVLLGPPSVCGYGGGAPFGLGLTELLPTPPPPFNDDITAFDLALPGRCRLFCTAFSLAPLSPTLTPGTNPLLPGGAEPGDILISCAGPPLAIFYGPTACGLGLFCGGPGCAPPFCDDIDALAFPALAYSLSPTSPSVIGPPFVSAADVLLPGLFPVIPAGAIGLLAADNVNALEFAFNPCPIFPGGDPPDFDGVDVTCGPASDNCPGTFNPGQEDTDGDGIGDVCDPCTDLDFDGFGNPGFPANLCPTDVCPFVPDPQTDTDLDGVGDACDNCPLVPNPSQTDTDFDGFGDACDVCPLVFDPGQADGDLDGAGDVCDNCPAVANPGQTNSDGDADGDACDSCPHVTGGVPGAMTVKKVILGYGSDATPGGGDDKPKVIKAVFSTGAAFDPDSTDDVHVTLVNTGTGGTLFAPSLVAGSPPWTQSDPAVKKWKYSPDPITVGVKKAILKENPPASMTYAFKMIGKEASISAADAPLTVATDDVAVTLEIESGGVGVCFSATVTDCANKSPSKDLCKTP